MIAMLSGTVADVSSDRIILDVGGIGFEMMVPVTVLEVASHTDALRVYTYMHVREDAVLLFGFMSLQERRVFEQLIGVSGIGPKTALAVLSAMPGDRLASAIRAGDPTVFKSVSGVGPKTASRLILELQGKLTAGVLKPGLMSGSGGPDDETLEALVSLGYHRTQALEAVDRARKETGASDTPSLIRAALKFLSGS